MAIRQSTQGDLCCRETKQKFGTKYYTLKTKESTFIQDLESRGGKPESGAGLKVIYPNQKIDECLLRNLLEGETFPGSGVRTADVIENVVEAQELSLWKSTYPHLFEAKKVVEQAAPVAQKAKAKKSAVVDEPVAKPADDPFGELEV